MYVGEKREIFKSDFYWKRWLSAVCDDETSIVGGIDCGEFSVSLL